MTTTPTAPAPSLIACPVTGCDWHRSLVLHELDSDGERVFAVAHGPAVAEGWRVVALHADRHAGVHADDPGPVAPDDEWPADEGELGPILEAWVVPPEWYGE
jgi:hypothetical protein